MKILHTADLHLSSPLTSRLSGKKSVARRRELRETFIRMTEYARDNGVDAFIIAGDLFDDESVSPTDVDAVLSAIRRCEGVEFYYLHGNHEGRAISPKYQEIPANLHLFSDDWSYYDIGNVRIAGRGKNSEGMFSELVCAPDKFNIAVLHGEVRDKCDGAYAIGLNEARETELDYIALGHYHAFREYRPTKRLSAVYSGVPEGRGFDEVGERGFVIIETDNDLRYRFVPFAKRLVLQINIDISSAFSSADIEKSIEENLVGVSRDNLIRIVLDGHRTPELRYDISYLCDIFKSGFYYLEIKDKSKIKINSEDYKYDKSLKGEFIRLCLANIADEETAAAVIECGLQALAGEGGEG